MTAAAYASTHDLASDRLRWSIALITRLVHHGRAEGWLAGTVRPPEQLPDPDAIADGIAARLAETPQAPERMPIALWGARILLEQELMTQTLKVLVNDKLETDSE